MNEKTMWMCVDKSDESQSSFGDTKQEAERRAADNRGYTNIAVAKTDDWIGDAVLITVHEVVAVCLLRRTADSV